MKKILFRTDSSDIIGTGHIMRSLVLANKFKNDKITFAVQNLPGNINYKVKNSGYNIEILKSNDINSLISFIKKYKFDLIVIDHYGISFDDEKKIKKDTGIGIFVLDDTYEKHYCDILLNHNYGADPSKYKTLVPKNTELRCGQKYSLIREEFINEKKNKKKYSFEKNKKILIAMGGIDSKNLNIEILESIKDFKDIDITVVTTRANKNLNKLKKFCNEYPLKIFLKVDTNQMAKLMKKASLVITTPSVTINECLFMNVPFIAIKTEKNQDAVAMALKKANFKVMDTFIKTEFLKMINEIILEK